MLEEEALDPRVLRVPRVLDHLVRVRVGVRGRGRGRGKGRVGLRVPRVLCHLGRPSEEEEGGDRATERS